MTAQETIDQCDALLEILNNSETRATETLSRHGIAVDHLPGTFAELFADDRRRIAALRAKTAGEQLADGIDSLEQRSATIEAKQACHLNIAGFQESGREFLRALAGQASSLRQRIVAGDTMTQDDVAQIVVLLAALEISWGK